jgi:hypothetical protein
MANYGDLKARIKDELSRSTDPDIDAQIARSVNDAINFYSSQGFWFLEVENEIETVSGQPDYDLPDDWRPGSEITVTITDSRYLLRRRSYNWYRERAYRAAADIGQPSDYAIFGQRVWLKPTPNALYVVTLTYNAAPPVLDLETDENGWTNDAEPLIRTRAKIDLLTNVIREADPTEISLLQSEELRWRGSLARRTAEQTMTGQVRPSDW